MIIQKIEISNFRGIRKGEFSFDESPFILLSAPNGLGKTTLIDAVEWCLTGNIGRLILAYNSRGTNDTERKKATQGILRNKYALPDEDTTVILKIKEKDKEYSIKRSHTKDELDGMSISKEKSKVVIMGSNGKNEKEKWLQQLIGESFYNYHFCDLQKSFSIQR